MESRLETESLKFLLVILMFIQLVTLNDSAACRDMPEVPNAQLDLKDRTPPFALGTVIAFRCSLGYSSTTGIRKIACHEDSNGNAVWDELLHVCTPISCSFPGEVKNARSKGNVYTFANNVTYVCNDGFTLIGVGTIYCMSSGKWRPALPHCQANTAVTQSRSISSGTTPKAVRCPYPGESKNINVLTMKESYEVGEIITYKCDDHEPIVAKCLRNGKWTELKQCQDTTVKPTSEHQPSKSSIQENPSSTEVTAPTTTDPKQQTVTDQKQEDVTATNKEHHKVTEVSQADHNVTTRYEDIQCGVESTAGLTCTPSILCINFCIFWSFCYSVTFLFSYFYDCPLHNAKKSKIQ